MKEPVMLIEAINQLFREYDYYEPIVEVAKRLPLNLENLHRKGLPAIFYLKRKELDVHFLNRPKLYLAELIDFFRSVGGEIQIIGKVTNPRHGEVKGASRKITFNDEELVYNLELFLNKQLFHKEEGEYAWRFNEEEKPFLYVPSMNPWSDDETGIVGYSEEGLSAILNYERKLERQEVSMPDRARIGKLLHFLYNRLKEFNIVGNNGKPTQKEYCFLYDYLVIQERVTDLGMYEYTGPIGKEKYNVVRNFISSYMRWYKKRDE